MLHYTHDDEKVETFVDTQVGRALLAIRERAVAIVPGDCEAYLGDYRPLDLDVIEETLHPQRLWDEDLEFGMAIQVAGPNCSQLHVTVPLWEMESRDYFKKYELAQLIVDTLRPLVVEPLKDSFDFPVPPEWLVTVHHEVVVSHTYVLTPEHGALAAGALERALRAWMQANAPWHAEKDGHNEAGDDPTKNYTSATALEPEAAA